MMPPQYRVTNDAPPQYRVTNGPSVLSLLYQQLIEIYPLYWYGKDSA